MSDKLKGIPENMVSQVPKGVEVKIADPITVKLDKMPEIVNKKKEKIKIFWYSDFLRHTGFGNVAEELVSRLNKTGKYTIVVLGINYHGVPYCTPKSEYYHLRDIPVYPAFSAGARASLFGYDVLESFLRSQEFDIFFSLQDAFNLIPMHDVISKTKKIKGYKYILYFPVDGDIKKTWVEKAIKLADKPITYTEFGKQKVKEKNEFVNVDVIPHGVDLEKFKPFSTPKERTNFRSEYFGIGEEVFLISNVNRNQPRKDLPRTILAFKKFCEQNKNINAKLYLHCHPRDEAGHRLHEFSENYLPESLWDRIIMPPEDLMSGNGVSSEVLRKIYASSDMVTSTAFGEGWGLSTVEAMACKVPVVMPNNSATTEIVGANNERGYLVKSGGDNLSDYITLKFDNELLRPLTDIDDLVKNWKYVYDNREEAKSKAEEAYKWLQEYTWDKVAKKWEDVFDSLYADKVK